MGGLKWLALVVVVGYAGCVAALFLLQRSFLFPIPTATLTSPSDAGLPEAEEVVLTTSDGEKVIVWHIAAQAGRPVVLYFHGNGDVLAWQVERFRAITADGTGLVALSYRGYAGSTGRPSEIGLIADAEAAYSFALARYDARRLVVWGFSLGSGVAVALASRHPIGKLILEAAYTSIAEVAAEHFPLLPARWLVRDQFRSDERIGQVRVPLLMMHGARDTTIPIRFGEALFGLAHDPKQFVRFPDGEHNDLSAHGALDVARRFISAP